MAEIIAKTIITKSKLPGVDYCFNPYIGCSHRCAYCYARFMGRFTGHANEQWGTYLDWKINAFDPYTTFLGGIYSNGRAFKYLKEKGDLDKGICPSCGASPIDNKYTYRSGLASDRVFNICELVIRKETSQ